LLRLEIFPHVRVASTHARDEVSNLILIPPLESDVELSPTRERRCAYATSPTIVGIRWSKYKTDSDGVINFFFYKLLTELVPEKQEEWEKKWSN
jgi:hypothetical protein